MSPTRILLIEDEEHIAQGLIFNLSLENYQVIHVATGKDAIKAVQNSKFDLVVLDLMLPDSYGIDICHKIRSFSNKLPILILTALGEEEHRIQGLAAGADDYLSKPFNLHEFLLRVKGMLRRSAWYTPEKRAEGIYEFGSNRVDLKNLTAVTTKEEFRLTELEGRMLELFFANEGQTLTRPELLKSVWGLTEDTETRTLDNFIVRLRKYFEHDPSNPKHFLTVRGRGYQFVRTPK